MKKTVTMILMVLAVTMAGAQDLAQYKRVIKELSSAKYQGRGYAKDGANKMGRSSVLAWISRCENIRRA